MKSVALVLHALPGRTRLGVPTLLDRPELARYFEKKLGSVPGVSRASFSALTGRALVEFDGRILTCEDIAAQVTMPDSRKSARPSQEPCRCVRAGFSKSGSRNGPRPQAPQVLPVAVNARQFREARPTALTRKLLVGFALDCALQGSWKLLLSLL